MWVAGSPVTDWGSVDRSPGVRKGGYVWKRKPKRYDGSHCDRVERYYGTTDAEMSSADTAVDLHGSDPKRGAWGHTPCVPPERLSNSHPSSRRDWAVWKKRRKEGDIAGKRHRGVTVGSHEGSPGRRSRSSARSVTAHVRERVRWMTVYVLFGISLGATALCAVGWNKLLVTTRMTPDGAYVCYDNGALLLLFLVHRHGP